MKSRSKLMVGLAVCAAVAIGAAAAVTPEAFEALVGRVERNERTIEALRVEIDMLRAELKGKSATEDGDEEKAEAPGDESLNADDLPTWAQMETMTDAQKEHWAASINGRRVTVQGFVDTVTGARPFTVKLECVHPQRGESGLIAVTALVDDERALRLAKGARATVTGKVTEAKIKFAGGWRRTEVDGKAFKSHGELRVTLDAATLD